MEPSPSPALRVQSQPLDHQGGPDLCFLPVQPCEKEPLGGTQDTWMSVLGTCSGILQLYQYLLFHSLKKKEESCIRFRMPLWPEGWGGPRGLMRLPPQGMGGQHGYFGLWIDVDFGKGHSKAKPTCTTYGSPQLSAQEDFQFQKMEVWAVGEAPKAESVRKTRSILDIDPEARALLEASGRGRHSEGLREVPDEP